MRSSDWSSDVCSSDLMWPDALSIEPSPVRRSSKCQIASPLSWTRVTEGTGLTRATDAIQTAWASSINAFTASAGSSLSTITCVSKRSQEAPVFPDSSRSSGRSEEHTPELQSLMRNSYALFCLQQKHHNNTPTSHTP